MSWAKAALSVVVDHGVAAVLDHDERAAEPLEPRQRLDEGLRPWPRQRLEGRSGRAGREGWSCGVRRVLVDVVVGEVVGPDRRGLGRRRAGRRRRGPRAGVRSTRRAVLAHAAGAAHLDAVDGDVERGGSKAARGGADGGEDAAPVGVAAEDGALEQVVAGDRRGRPRARRHSSRPSAPRSRCRGAAPSASAMSCRARSAHTAVTASVSSSASGVTPEAPEASSSTVSLVDMQPSESIRSKVVAVAARSAASSVAASATASVVSDDEHRREGRGEHAGALGHAADRPAVALATGTSCCTVSVVMIALGGVGAAVGGQGGRGAGRRRRAAGPSGAARRSARSSRRRRRRRRRRATSRDVLGGGVGVGEPLRRRCTRWRRRS